MERRLAAILAADVTGYSRLMAADEAGTLARLNHLRKEVIEPRISQLHGRIVGSAGDSLLVEFASAVNAVTCAVQMQEALAERNAKIPDSQRMAFRMGVNLGDVIAEGGTIHGDGVNVAARLEKLAEPGGVCISRSIYDRAILFGFSSLDGGLLLLTEQPLGIGIPVARIRRCVDVVFDAAKVWSAGIEEEPERSGAAGSHESARGKHGSY